MIEQRLFVALDLPMAIKALIAELQTQLRRQQPAAAVRWADPGGAHLTLKYLGETTARAAIEQQLALLGPQHAPFILETGALGVFPNARQPRVVWLGVGSQAVAPSVPPILKLQAAVEQQLAPLGFPTEARPFAPHLTLGRTTPSGRYNAAHARALTPPAVVWQVNELVLMRSESGPGGVRYSPIYTVPLTGKPV